ncbi:MAG: hypothetical protein ACYTEL_09835 [Planctomycetota bacterium]|jgi:hypothetical protein
MRLTLEQRLQALERDIVILQDTTKILHKMLKDQGSLINDYILQRVSSQQPAGGDPRPEDAVYTFICKKRFDKIERDIKRILKTVEGRSYGLKAG